MTPVLDASAVIAALTGEKGHEQAAAALESGVVSVVNLAETVAALVRKGLPAQEAVAAVELIGTRSIPADLAQATDAGTLRALTDAAGLSLGDRFCLALARRLGGPVVTADRAWASVAEAVGVEVRLIR